MQVELVRVYAHSKSVQFCTQVHSDSEYLHSDGTHPRHADYDPREPATFRHTCSQVMHEIGDIYFALNTFKLYNNCPDDFTHYHFKLTPLKFIRSVVVPAFFCRSKFGYPSKVLIEFLATLESLSRVNVALIYCCGDDISREKALEKAQRLFEENGVGSSVEVVLR
jgi:hypothetical protein